VYDGTPGTPRGRAIGGENITERYHTPADPKEVGGYIVKVLSLVL